MTVVKNSPRYCLLKPFPGMKEVVGTVFCKYEGWTTFGTTKGRHDTDWVQEEYFEPYIGEYFEKL